MQNFNLSLADKAMLVRFKIKRQAHSVRDDAATAYVEQQFGVSSAGQFNKKLFKSSERYAALNTALNTAAAYHRDNTLPWLDGGFRVLPNHKYMEYTQTMQTHTAEVERLAEDFASNWYNEVSADMARLGSMANPDDYAIRQDIGLEVRLMPLPADSDFRVSVTDADKQAFNDALAEVDVLAKRDLVSRVTAPLTRINEKLKSYTGEKGQRFHEDTVAALGDILEMVESLNINDDPAITQLCSDVRLELGHYIDDPRQLKQSQHTRDYASEKIDQILAGFAH